MIDEPPTLISRVNQGLREVAIDMYVRGVEVQDIVKEIGVTRRTIQTWTREYRKQRFKQGRVTDTIAQETPAQQKENMAIEKRIGHTHGKEKTGVRFLADSTVDPTTKYGVDRRLEEEANRLLRGEK